MSSRVLLSLILLASAAPAFAEDGGAQVPEASAGMLFALGVLGVIVGRNAAKRTRKDRERP